MIFSTQEKLFLCKKTVEISGKSVSNFSFAILSLNYYFYIDIIIKHYFVFLKAVLFLLLLSLLIIITFKNTVSDFIFRFKF